ncbi:MAG: cysteine--tRNA ligase [Candidatus Margulisbacteria bacterium]|nr:cysteine--tRNA ligase [Candidatus Margulisiibacteriota bacterium]
MPLKIYNTLTRQKEEFQPLNSPKVGMYVCGITPYDETHLGHGRAYVTFDVIKRYLEFLGYEVNHVQNITDVDDKIIKKSKVKSQNYQKIVEEYTKSYFEVMDKLNVKRANIYPKATEHVPEMVKWIGGLVDRGYAYQLEDGVYFEVDKFEGYGKLSGKKKEEQEPGARVKVESSKKNPLDFALWKKAKPGEPSWPSPWGEGRPGWHIECSVMSTKYLGEQFDIHGGGMDLEFPHHENEIAQTEALTGKIPWVKYWVHNGFVNINKQKMSKSLGNFFTLRDIFEKFDPMVIRFFLLMTHYRSPINYSDGEIESVREAFGRIQKFIQDIAFLISKTTESAPEIEIRDINEDMISFRDKFSAAMDDDFNTAGAIAAIFDMIKYCRKTLDEGEAERECLEMMKKSVIDLCEVLGLKLESRASAVERGTQEIDVLIAEREEARKNKDFKKADQIRDEINALLKKTNSSIVDTPFGARVVQL